MIWRSSSQSCANSKLNEKLASILDQCFINTTFRLYRERITQIQAKLSEVKEGKASEYLQPLEELQVNMKNRLETGSILKELRQTTIQCKFEAEALAADQNFEVGENEHSSS